MIFGSFLFFYFFYIGNRGWVFIKEGGVVLFLYRTWEGVFLIENRRVVFFLEGGMAFLRRKWGLWRVFVFSLFCY